MTRNTEFYAGRYDTARLRFAHDPMKVVAIDAAEARALIAELEAWLAEVEEAHEVR